MYRCECGGRVIWVEGELVCEKCGLTVKDQFVPTCFENEKLGSYIGRYGEDASRYRGFTEGENKLLKRYSDLYLRPSLEKNEMRLEAMAERLEFQLGLPRHLREEALKIVLMNGPNFSEGLMAYAYVLAARRRGIWALSWHVIHKKLRELGYKAEVSYSLKYNIGKKVRASYYLPHIVERVVFYIRGRSKGRGSMKYFTSLLNESERVLALVDKVRFTGHSPYSMAVTCVFLAEQMLARKERRKAFFTQKELARLTGVSIYTIREISSFVRGLLSELDEAVVLKSVIKPSVKYGGQG
jgi:transcription initiation factor TFIIIB Brf1 subunit/transcription initiation factor TFIIB